MEIRVHGDMGVNCELVTGTADRIITIPLNGGEIMIRAKVTDTTSHTITRIIQAVNYDAEYNYNGARQW